MAIGINNFQIQNNQEPNLSQTPTNLRQSSTSSSFNIRMPATQNELTKNLSVLNSIKDLANKQQLNQLTSLDLGSVINKEVLQKFSDSVLFDSLTNLDEEVEDTISVINADDDISYTNFSIESSFIDENLKNILVNMLGIS